MGIIFGEKLGQRVIFFEVLYIYHFYIDYLEYLMIFYFKATYLIDKDYMVCLKHLNKSYKT